MKEFIAVAVALVMLCACSRTAPIESKNSPSSESEESQGIQSNPLEESGKPNPQKMNVEAREIVNNNVEMYYAVPQGNEGLEESSELITAKIEEILSVVSGSFDMSVKDAHLTLYDNVTKNTEGTFSVEYEAEYKSSKVPNGSRVAFGLTFNVKTGAQVALDTIVQPHLLAKQIIEAPADQIINRKDDAQKVKKQIEDMGISAIADRIVASQSQKDADHLMTFSYYLDGDYIVAILPIESGDGGDYALIKVDKLK